MYLPQFRHLKALCTCSEFTITRYTWAGGGRFVKELMALLGLTAQQIVTLARSFNGGSNGAAGGRKFTSPARKIAEGVIGRVAWDVYKYSTYKATKGPRKSIGSSASQKVTTARNKRLGGSMKGWTLETEPQYFQDVDTVGYGRPTHVVVT